MSSSSPQARAPSQSISTTQLEEMELPPAPAPAPTPSNTTSTIVEEPTNSTVIAATPAATPRTGIWQHLLQKAYNPPFLSPSASLIHAQGTLKKFGSKLTLSSLNARYFVLGHHSLQYYKSDPFSKPQGSLSLIGARVVVEADDAASGFKPAGPGCVFSITTAATAGSVARKYVLVASSDEEKQVWMDILLPSTTESTRSQLHAENADNWEKDINLCLEGWLNKSSAEVKAGNWNKRYFMFQRSTHTLIYLKSPPKAAGFVPIETGALVDVVGKPSTHSGSLSVYSQAALSGLPVGIDTLSILAYTQSQDRCYVLLADSKQKRDDWVDQLRCAVEYRSGHSKSYEKKPIVPVVSSSIKASSALAAVAAATVATSSTTASSTLTTATPASTSPPSNPPATPTRPPPTVPTPASPTPLSSPPPAKAPPPVPSSSASPPPLTQQPSLVNDSADDDEWVIPGRAKGESVSYVNLKATQPPPQPLKPSLLNVTEESENEDDELLSPSRASSVASPSSSVSPSSSSTSNLSLVERSILELYTTETTYVLGLQTIIQQYLLRFRKHMELKLEPKWFEDGEYSQFTLFQHVETIRDINTRLLKELEAIQKDDTTNTSATVAPATPSSVNSLHSRLPSIDSLSVLASPNSGKILSSLSLIGRTFRQFIPFFKVYTLFAQSYDEQLKALDALAEKRAGLKNFLLLTDMCENTTLASLMITPVQRVGRYVLLLETILRNVPDGYAGAADVEGALNEMKKVGILINETVALWEAKSKVVELQAKIDVPIMAPGRFVVREGVLKKLYNRADTGFFSKNLGKKSDSFVFFLMNDVLIQAKKNQLNDNFTHRCTMPLYGMTIEDIVDTNDSPIKYSWTITYSTTAVPTATVTTTGQRPSESDSLSANPMATLRPPSLQAASTLAGSSSNLLTGTTGGDENKQLTLYAGSAEEKSLWLSDLMSLIEQTKQKNKTLMRG